MRTIRRRRTPVNAWSILPARQSTPPQPPQQIPLWLTKDQTRLQQSHHPLHHLLQSPKQTTHEVPLRFTPSSNALPVTLSPTPTPTTLSPLLHNYHTIPTQPYSHYQHHHLRTTTHPPFSGKYQIHTYPRFPMRIP